MRISFFLGLLCLSVLLVPKSSHGEQFRLLAWNVESNRPTQPAVSDSRVIASQLAELLSKPETRAHLIALSEVEPRDFFRYRDAVQSAISSDVDFVTSASGGFQDTDSLQLIVDRSRFEIVSAVELHRWDYEIGNTNIEDANSEEFGALRARSPLAVLLKDLTSELDFWVVVNHLARGEADLRTQQARMLVKWVKSTPLPAISAGDFNFDFDFNTRKGNAGFDAMLEGGVWGWVEPDPLIDSNWSRDRRVIDGNVDRFPDSILDFIFVANEAQQWRSESNVVVRDGDFPDTDETSDHRPIIATFDPSSGGWWNRLRYLRQ